MDKMKNGWFSESNSLWPGQSFSMEVDKVVHHEKSEYQDILILETKTFGRVLVLDGVIQCTEKDEFSYQEMMSFVPLNCHSDPQKVLIVGGGDGGVAREVVKHPLVDSVVLCEIDRAVIAAARSHLPFMGCGFDSSKVRVHIGDGREYMAEHSSQFDVIITDSSDPVGPASSLFEDSYYRLMWQALRPGGVVCCQGENMWYHQDLIRGVLSSCRKHYSSVAYGQVAVPTYPGGQIGLIVACKDRRLDFSDPVTQFTEEQLEAMQLRYYSCEVHRAAFSLPRFASTAFN